LGRRSTHSFHASPAPLIFHTSLVSGGEERVKGGVVGCVQEPITCHRRKELTGQRDPSYLQKEGVRISPCNGDGTPEALCIGSQGFVPQLIHDQLREVENGLPNVDRLVEEDLKYIYVYYENVKIANKCNIPLLSSTAPPQGPVQKPCSSGRGACWYR
jgi:hypothetical protein